MYQSMSLYCSFQGNALTPVLLPILVLSVISHTTTTNTFPITLLSVMTIQVLWVVEDTPILSIAPSTSATFPPTIYLFPNDNTTEHCSIKAVIINIHNIRIHPHSSGTPNFIPILDLLLELPWREHPHGKLQHP